jgi:hypothetical protein
MNFLFSALVDEFHAWQFQASVPLKNIKAAVSRR